MFGIEDRKLYIITRILTVILSIGVIACGVLRIILDNSSLVLISCYQFLIYSVTCFLGVWTLYWILFGIILLLGELRFKYVINYCSFLRGNIGKGLYIIFVGSIMLISFFKWYTVVGIVLMFLGVVIMILNYDPNAAGVQSNNPIGA